MHFRVSPKNFQTLLPAGGPPKERPHGHVSGVHHENFKIPEKNCIHVFILIFLNKLDSTCLTALTNTLNPMLDPQVYFEMHIIVEYINIMFIILKTHVLEGVCDSCKTCTIGFLEKH